MADVRSLFRSELASRRIKHPHVSYSSNGLALCNICHLSLRSDSFWEPHQRSKAHRENLQKTQGGDTNNGPLNKKRKVESDNSDDEGRKKAKSGTETPSESLIVQDEDITTPANITTATEQSIQKLLTPNGSSALQGLQVHPGLSESTSEPVPTDIPLDSPTALDRPGQIAQNTVDEDEWASFEREVALPTHQAQSTLLNASATITAAPISAAELAAVEESAGAQKRTRREEEMEGEKEDAARQLEEEFDQMEELDEKLKRMRERVEGIRRRRSTVGEADSLGVKEMIVGETTAGIGQEENAVGEEDERSDDEDDEEDEWDSWRFR